MKDGFETRGADNESLRWWELGGFGLIVGLLLLSCLGVGVVGGEGT